MGGRSWLCGMKKKDEEKRMEADREKFVNRMIASADGEAGLLHKITKPTALRGGMQILKEEEEDAQPLARCEEKRKEWAKHWQCDMKKNLEDDDRDFKRAILTGQQRVTR